MRELIRTNDPVLISFVESVLTGEGITVFVADQHMSVLEGSLAMLERRIMVREEDIGQARTAVVMAGVERELLSPDPGPLFGSLGPS